ncbi:MAG: DUF4974 domain-containing protein [Prevotella sp.]|nr:DUF4974 domain-containing protein [Prevotella sp.]
MEKERLHNAVESIINGDIIEEEKHLKTLQEEFLHGDASKTLHNYESYDAVKAYDKFIERIKPSHRIGKRWTITAVAIAASIAALFIIAPNIYNKEETQAIVTITMEAQGINTAKGEKKKSTIPAHSTKLPTLRLANGEIVELTGQDIHLSALDIHTAGNSIAISTASDKVQQLQLSIPRGRQFDLTLSDGTHVWLNSETTLTFPSRFENERKVTVSGQAFFDVTHNGLPFRVECSRGVINVMGTTFDVRDYANDMTQVTLVSGSVEYTSTSSSKMLAPGEQIRHEISTASPTVCNVNTHQYTAWKDGLIYFYEQRLEDVMKEIERIYDVHISFDDAYLLDRLFTGECSRYESVEEFLRLLSLTDEFSYIIEKNNNQKYITITIKQ